MTMNKNQGILAGAILAVAILLRPLGVNVPTSSDSSRPSQVLPTDLTKGAKETEVAREGPWVASCGYWSPARAATDPRNFPAPSKQPSWHQVLGEVIRGTEAPEPGCGTDPEGKWGFPGKRAPIDLTAIIVTVPDPVHTHLAMEFDRTVTAILQAASDSGFVSSYYWLPWRIRLDLLRGVGSPGELERGHDAEREREPGLIVLKHVPTINIRIKNPSSLNRFDKAIYLFLVAETPTKGVDGYQLQRAFAYESQLATILKKSGGHFSRGFSRGKENGISIIGPWYSGSAASLRAAMDASCQSAADGDDALRKSKLHFLIMGDTSTDLSKFQITTPPPASTKDPCQMADAEYYSFGANNTFAEAFFFSRLIESGYDTKLFTRLVEDNTSLGQAVTHPFSKNGNLIPQHTIGFPREISLLRNAEVESDASSGSGASGSIPSPYLHFSAKDSGAQDSVPLFSREHTPLSQEAQLMTIARQLEQSDIQFVKIQASDPLDTIFLARFLRRAYPDAQYIVRDDLLMARDIDNAPYIGSISIGPYTLIGGLSSGRVYTDSTSIGIYNAARCIIRQAIVSSGQSSETGGFSLPLKGYMPLGASSWPYEPALWASVNGWDGYYPLGVLSLTASDSPEFMPRIAQDGTIMPPPFSAAGQRQAQTPEKDVPSVTNFLGHLKEDGRIYVYASLPWTVLAWLVSLLCLWHAATVFTADYWSPQTRDLAVRDNDQPYRRSMYIHAATASLVLVAFAVFCPMLEFFLTVQTNFKDRLTAGVLFICGMIAAAATIAKTRGFSWIFKARSDGAEGPGPKENRPSRQTVNWYFPLASLTWILAAAFVAVWGWLCLANEGGKSVCLQGLCFSYRCIHPLSLVSPLAPVILLLFGWYFWGMFQTWRLQFSEAGRPHLTDDPCDELDHRFLISDQDLGRKDSRRNSVLYENIECLTFNSRLLRRFLDVRSIAFEAVLIAVGVVILFALAVKQPRSVDHFLWDWRSLSSPYEMVVGFLLFPLLWFSCAGWLRLHFVWAALKRGLLNRLEDQPIRFAFDRLKGMGWMTMLSRMGLNEQWRDMDRCTESICQMLHDPDLKQHLNQQQMDDLRRDAERIVANSGELRQRKFGPGNQSEEESYELMRQIDQQLAGLGRALLTLVLIPYWRDVKTGLVESEKATELPIAARLEEGLKPRAPVPVALYAGHGPDVPARIVAAEEFVAIRYMSLIRAVLTNMRYLMAFFTLTFVLTIVAWNSYPFQPRQIVDWLFTGLLVFMGAGVIWVFAQMHRDPILSRVTDTKPNELGWDFYFRIVTYGAIPVITWLAYEFPNVGSTIYRFVQPGNSVFK